MKSSNRGNKLILVLVEGLTDKKALYYPLNSIFSSVYDDSYGVEFSFMEGTRLCESGGDITSEKSSSPKSIEKLINFLMVDNFFHKSSWKKDDLAGIIQFSDTDGAFIHDSLVVKNLDKGCTKPQYFSDHIEVNNSEIILERNHRKAENMLFLSKKSSIEVSKTRSVPYSYHYFSSNIDTYFYGLYNPTLSEKNKNADSFLRKCAFGYSLEDEYEQNTTLSKYTTLRMNYDESWAYIQQGLHSLERGSNLNTLFNKINDGFFDCD